MLTFHWSGHHRKRGPTEGAELKKVLFLLNTFFLEDKNLVVDFIQVGGLAQRVILGKEEEVQLQNFILRCSHALRGRHAGRDAAHSGE